MLCDWCDSGRRGRDWGLWFESFPLLSAGSLRTRMGWGWLPGRGRSETRLLPERTRGGRFGGDDLVTVVGCREWPGCAFGVGCCWVTTGRGWLQTGPYARWRGVGFEACRAQEASLRRSPYRSFTPFSQGMLPGTSAINVQQNRQSLVRSTPIGLGCFAFALLA